MQTNQCSLHKQERQWIYSIGIEQERPLVIKEGAVLESKFECYSCHKILMKALGFEFVKRKKHGRRRKN